MNKVLLSNNLRVNELLVLDLFLTFSWLKTNDKEEPNPKE